MAPNNKVRQYQPGLKQILSLVRGLQSKHVLLLGVVRGLCSERVMDTNSVVQVVAAELVLAKAVFVLVQVEHEVAQRAVEHLPAALVKRG